MSRAKALTSMSLLSTLACSLQDACDEKLDPDEFVENMKKMGIRVPGIGHRIKSKVQRAQALLARFSLSNACVGR